MLLAYPETCSFFIKAFLDDENYNCGTGVCVRLREKACDVTVNYILTCSHVVRLQDGDWYPSKKGCLSKILDSISIWWPGQGFADNALRASLAYSPTHRDEKVTEDHELVPSQDWVLLEVNDPGFQANATPVGTLADSAEGPIRCYGFPGGLDLVKESYIVNVKDKSPGQITRTMDNLWVYEGGTLPSSCLLYTSPSPRD